MATNIAEGRYENGEKWELIKYLSMIVDCTARKKMDEYTLNVKFYGDGDFEIVAIENIDQQTWKSVVCTTKKYSYEFVVYYEYFGVGDLETEFITEFDENSMQIKKIKEKYEENGDEDES